MYSSAYYEEMGNKKQLRAFCLVGVSRVNAVSLKKSSHISLFPQGSGVFVLFNLCLRNDVSCICKLNGMLKYEKVYVPGRECFF